MARLTWRPAARQDLRDLRRFTSRDSPAAADRMIERILATIDRLREFPESGRIIPEFGDRSIREVIVSPYRVLYHIDTGRNAVRIIAVVHSGRMLPDVRLND